MSLYSKEFSKDSVPNGNDDQYFYNVERPSGDSVPQSRFAFDMHSVHAGSTPLGQQRSAIASMPQTQPNGLYPPQGGHGMGGQDSIHNSYGLPSSTPSRMAPGSGIYSSQPGGQSILGSTLSFPQTVNPPSVPNQRMDSSMMLAAQNIGSRLGPSLLREEESHEDFPALPSKMDHMSGLDASLTPPGSYPSVVSPSFAPSAVLPPATVPLGGAKDEKYGLAGLMEVNRSTEKDSYLLSMGMDLTTFGLNLNSAESLYLSFTSPFADASQSDPQFTIPQCYNLHPPVLKNDHLSKFHLETLFYMFYQLPRDILQACAAQELYRRDWKFHAELRIWLKARTALEMQQSHPTIQFVYFDAKAWEVRLFNSSQVRGNLKAGLVPEEDIRVKPPLPGLAPIVESS